MKFVKNIDHLCSAVNVESISTNICTKKVFLAIFCILVLTISFVPLPVNADIGPKPSVVISFKGLEGETYYATLLSKAESTGPYSVLKDGESKESNYADNNEDYNSISIKIPIESFTYQLIMHDQ